MASDFLNDLKKAVEEGEFPSKAVKKIIEVDELAKSKFGSDVKKTINPNKLFDEVLEINVSETKNVAAEIKTVTSEEAAMINSEYEKKMQELKELDLALQQIKILKEIEDMVVLSVKEMGEFIVTLEQSFDKTKLINTNLFAEIERIKTKYSSITNN